MSNFYKVVVRTYVETGHTSFTGQPLKSVKDEIIGRDLSRAQAKKLYEDTTALEGCEVFYTKM